MSRAPATVAEAWQDYADDVFPIDVDEKTVTPVRRAYMHALLTAARMVEAGAAEQAEIEAGMKASVEKARKSKNKLDAAGNPFGAAGTVQ